MKPLQPHVPTCKPVALLVPHDHYLFSGRTAAFAFARIHRWVPKRIVFINASSQLNFSGLSLYSRSSFKTALTSSPADREFRNILKKRLDCICPENHDEAHHISMPLSYVQHIYTYDDKIPVVSLLLGEEASDFHVGLGKELAAALSEDDLLICTSDLDTQFARNSDGRQGAITLTRIQNGDISGLMEGLQQGICALSASAAVVTMMSCCAARGVPEGFLLDYGCTTTFDTREHWITGFASVSFEKRILEDEL
jgi:AmmeMemoRadiSam system protein B